MSRRRHLLMITLDFPPVATSGALRLASFARHLPEHDWRTTVLTIRGSFYADFETGGVDPLPPDCEVVRAFGFDIKRALSWRGRYAGALAFPDRAVPWVGDGVRQALAVCRRQPIDAIVSSSPVVSAHLIGYVVKKLTGRPWVADLRDPWNLLTPHGALLRRLDEALERRLLSAADRITAVNPGLLADLGRRLGEGTRSRSRLLANGYDESAMASVLESATRPTRFSIIHTGSCQPPYRDPTSFFRAVRLCLDRGDLPATTSIDLIGAPVNSALQAEVVRLQLGSHVQPRARMVHREALQATARAALLLVLQTRPDHDLCVPVKTYEYLRTDRAILGLVRAGGETARLLRGFAGVTLVSPDDVEGIAAALAAIHRAWAAGQADRFTRDVACYSRQRIAAELAAVLDEMRAAA